mmetsp:Transcript_59884/g.177516  ORF Transcript_59884/g.177516 Transcript_59884/m.177516 type:complete len:274 (+) Transcript_59884:2218-3039(+)
MVDRVALLQFSAEDLNVFHLLLRQIPRKSPLLHVHARLGQLLLQSPGGPPHGHNLVGLEHLLGLMFHGLGPPLVRQCPRSSLALPQVVRLPFGQGFHQSLGAVQIQVLGGGGDSVVDDRWVGGDGGEVVDGVHVNAAVVAPFKCSVGISGTVDPLSVGTLTGNVENTAPLNVTRFVRAVCGAVPRGSAVVSAGGGREGDMLLLAALGLFDGGFAHSSTSACRGRHVGTSRRPSAMGGDAREARAQGGCHGAGGDLNEATREVSRPERARRLKI